MRSKFLIPRLLSGRNRLTRPEKDLLLEAVLAQVRPNRTRARWGIVAVPGAAVAAAAVLAIALLSRDSVGPEFASRGQVRDHAALRVECGAPGRGCRTGDQLLFDVDGTTGFRYFAAFARRPDGVILWYLPTRDAESSVDLSAAVDRGVLARAGVIGADHPAGHYRVYGVFSHEPLDRAAIRDRFDPTRTALGPDAVVVMRELEIR